MRNLSLALTTSFDFWRSDPCPLGLVPRSKVLLGPPQVFGSCCNSDCDQVEWLILCCACFYNFPIDPWPSPHHFLPNPLTQLDPWLAIFHLHERPVLPQEQDLSCQDPPSERFLLWLRPCSSEKLIPGVDWLLPFPSSSDISLAHPHSPLAHFLSLLSYSWDSGVGSILLPFFWCFGHLWPGGLWIPLVHSHLWSLPGQVWVGDFTPIPFFVIILWP